VPPGHRSSLSHLELHLLLQVLVGSLQKLLCAQNAVPHHVLGATPAWEAAEGETDSVLKDKRLFTPDGWKKPRHEKWFLTIIYAL